ARAKIGRHHARAVEAIDPLHHRRISAKRDARTHSLELWNVHESIFEDRLADHALAAREAHQHEKLRLHVGREARVRRGGDVHGAERAGAAYADVLPFARHFDAGHAHLEDERLEVRELDALERDV